MLRPGGASLILEDRFWSKVGAPDENGCRPWLASRFAGSQYGQFKVNARISGAKAKNYKAHALAWRLTYHGPTKPGAEIFRHCCDHPWCAEPAHVYPGTHAENRADCVARNRQAQGASHGWSLHPESIPRGLRSGRHTKPERTARGERNGRSRLTLAAVRDILQSPDSGPALAAKYGTTRTTISRVRLGKLWADAIAGVA